MRPKKLLATFVAYFLYPLLLAGTLALATRSMMSVLTPAPAAGSAPCATSA